MKRICLFSLSLSLCAYLCVYLGLLPISFPFGFLGKLPGSILLLSYPSKKVVSNMQIAIPSPFFFIFFCLILFVLSFVFIILVSSENGGWAAHLPSFLIIFSFHTFFLDLKKEFLKKKPHVLVSTFNTMMR